MLRRFEPRSNPKNRQRATLGPHAIIGENMRQHKTYGQTATQGRNTHQTNRPAKEKRVRGPRDAATSAP